MRIAIIGAGNVGGGLAAAAVRAGHDVVISASKPESAQAGAEATGATAAASTLDAVRGADVVPLAVPHGAVAGIVAELGDALNGTVVADATNPLNDIGARMARSLEEMAFLNIALDATNGWAWQSAWQLVGPTGSAS